MRRFAIFVGPLIGLALDQLLKWYSRHSLPPEGVFLIPGLLGLESFQNPGIAFGIAVPHLVLTLGSLLLAGGFGVWGWRRASLPALFVALGGLSNAIDRIFFGVTFDYLRIGPLSVINLADTMIAIGLFALLFQQKHRKKLTS